MYTFKLGSIYIDFVLLDFIHKNSGKTHKINKAFFRKLASRFAEAYTRGMI